MCIGLETKLEEDHKPLGHFFSSLQFIFAVRVSDCVHEFNSIGITYIVIS